MPLTRSQSRAALSCSLLEVPDNVLENILQRLDLQQRLSPVSQHWVQVARGCPIEIAGLHEDQLDDLLEYLDEYGDDISSMRLEAAWDGDPASAVDWPTLYTLPCSNLRDLELHKFQLQRFTATDPGVLSVCTGLTRLVIYNAAFIPSPGSEEADSGDADGDGDEEADEEAVAAAEAEAALSFASIQHLTHLQHLELYDITAVVEPPRGYWRWKPLHIPGEGLAALTRLTSLTLITIAANPRDTLQHISRLQQLRELELMGLPPKRYADEEDVPPPVDEAAAPTFAGLGALQHLTSLSVLVVPGTLTRQFLRGPGGQHSTHSSPLTALQLLRLQVVFEPALLAGMTQLTRLELFDVTFVLAPQHNSPAGPTSAPAHGLLAYQVLLLLPRLQQLRQLTLSFKEWPKAEHQLAAYSALTANTNLEYLDLHTSSAYCLPTPAWKHIFRKELQLPCIAALKIQGIAPRTSADRVLHCCPVAAAGRREGRVLQDCLQLRVLDREIENGELSPAELRLLEVNDDDPPGVPVVLGALTSLKVVFDGRFHEWSVDGFSEAEFQDGDLFW